MEGLQVLRGYIPAGIFTSLLLIFAIMSITVNARDFLHAIAPLRSGVTAVIKWLHGKLAKSDKPPINVERQSQQDSGTAFGETQSQQRPNHGQELDQPILFFLINNVVNIFEHEAQERRTKRQAKARRSPQPPKRSKQKPASDATSTADAQAGDTESVTPPSEGSIPTPQDVPPQTEDKGGSLVAPALAVADDSAESSHDASNIVDDSALIEAESTGQANPELEEQQASADVQIPISDEGARIDAGNSTATDKGSETVSSEPEAPLDERQTPSTDAVDNADLATHDEAAGAHEDVAVQAGVEEASDLTREQDNLPDHPATEDLDADSQPNASGAASIAEAIQVPQLTVPAEEPDGTTTLSTEQTPEADLSVPPSTENRPAEVDHVDQAHRDIDEIIDDWTAEDIGKTLRRLRQARGLLPTDLSYDPGWAVAFEAGRWYTRQTGREQLITGIRTYLNTLGMTPAELHSYLIWRKRSE